MNNIIKFHLVKNNKIILENHEYLDGFFHTAISQASITYDFDFLIITFDNGQTAKVPSKDTLILNKSKEISDIDHQRWVNDCFRDLK